MMRIPSRWIPLLAVIALIGFYSIYYPSAAPIRPALTWSATDRYFQNDFMRGGFGVECNIEPSLSCAVMWQGSGSSTPVLVYRCGADADAREAYVLAQFYNQILALTGKEFAAKLSGILDAFFQSGLRRTCDQMVQSGIDTPYLAINSPFDFRAQDADTFKAVAINPSFETTLTGLPRRPDFRGDIVAHEGNTVGSRNSGLSVIRYSTTSGSKSLGILDWAGKKVCRLWPDAPLSIGCQAATIHPCNPNRGYECQEAVLELWALPQSKILARIGSQQAANIFIPGRNSTSRDDLIVFGDTSQQNISVSNKGDKNSFTLDVFTADSVPVSSIRLVNSRWERWYEDGFEDWLGPVTDYYDRLANRSLTNPTTKVSLAMDLSLQQEIEHSLTEWMEKNVEEFSVAHLRRNHYATKTHTLQEISGELEHRRPVPQAGITVLNARTGELWALASYPPSEALSYEDGQPVFAADWKARLLGTDAPQWAVRQGIETLLHRLRDDTNANFVVHPIGSAFKPILLSLMVDESLPGTEADGLAQLFDLTIKSHVAADGTKIGGDEQIELRCDITDGCRRQTAESILGLPSGPWGREEGAMHGGPWIDRWEFLLDSCNKFALTLGVLSLLDWGHKEHGSLDACCWNPERDSIAFVSPQFPRGGTPYPDQGNIIVTPSALPPIGPWVDILDGQLSANSRLPEAPTFARLRHYYGISSRSMSSPYDADPWANCAGFHPPQPSISVGRIYNTQLQLTAFPSKTSFVNIFTGAGRNWWTNVKLAEAYARLALSSKIQASICSSNENYGEQFSNDSRQSELVKILSLQHSAPWVSLSNINNWRTQDDLNRIILSKTGTTLRSEASASTGVLAVYVGELVDRDLTDSLPTKVGNGIIIIAHVDDIGGLASGRVSELVDSIFDTVKERLKQ